MYPTWFSTVNYQEDDSYLYLLREKPNQRKKNIDTFSEIVRSHYDDLNKIADDIAALGYPHAAKILKEQLPTTKRAKSGELGEIMATEFAEANLGFEIPVKRLRYKDGRDMALRGDDFIGVYYEEGAKELLLLKGESKSNRNLSTSTITDARTVLNRDDGRCTPISLLFVSNRLLEGNEEQKALGRILRNEIALKTLKPEHIQHALFTLTGNDPERILRDDLKSADNKRIQHVINVLISDHQDFIKEVYKKVVDLGKR